MAKYLDEAGLSTLWTKIKETFVAQKIKKSSDSTDATSIVHNGQRVSLSTGKIMSSSTEPGKTVYVVDSSIVIDGKNIRFTADNRPSYRVPGEDFVDLVISSDIATSSTAGLVKSSTTGKTENRDYMVEVNPDGTMKVNVPWTDNTTTYSIATSSTPGLVKLGNDTVQSTAANSVTSTSSRTYAIQKNSNDQLVVNVPWTDTKITVDSALNSTSTNPVQNKVINAALSSTNTIVSSHTTAISTLESYFDNEGSALYAVNDEDGHSIIATYATKDELNTFKGLKGQSNGLAELDSTGRVPSSQLPSYVDDVIEGYYYNSKFYKESSHTTEITGESGKIYTDLDKNKTYRWSGTTYTEISASLALGTTSSTAYPGNLGATNAANIKTLQGYFTGDIANEAIADKNGKDITTTYATKGELGGKANLANGNNFTGNQSITGDLSVTSSSGAGKITIKGNSGNHPGGVILQTTATSSTTANTITIPAKTGTMALTSDIKTYSAGNGISLNGTTFSLNTGYTTSGKNYAVKTDSNKNLYVNVPWTDTNTTYSNGTGLKLSGTTFSLNTNYVATQSANGLMSAADKTKLDNIEAIPDTTINALS